MTHLKTRVQTDIHATLKGFKVGEAEFILFADSQTDTGTFSSRYQTLKREGAITGEFQFHRCNNPRGTTIVRIR
ncbi:MAG: hypothetical protein E7075_01665 [Bacteroidales bacterium]|mgnify:CR=1 FL=1|nr:hypothetical protein [Bacteroidales bacterium]